MQLFKTRADAHRESAAGPSYGLQLFAVAAVVFVVHLWSSTTPYWADGPRHLAAIRTRIYIIQPPGYWAFGRIAGLFSNPQQAIEWMNAAFCAGGVLAFQKVASKLVSRSSAQLGTLLYAVVFFAWFSGEIHSTYAAELFFPVWMFDFFLRHAKSRSVRDLIGAGVAFSAAFAFRPSDGVFLLPLCFAYLFKYATHKEALLWFSAVALVSLTWLVPTGLSYMTHRGGIAAQFLYTRGVTTETSLITNGVSAQALGNVVRLLLPLFIAFWPLSYAVVASLKRFRDDRVFALWLWIVPGAAFFAICYMSNAPYVNYFTAAVILLAMVHLESSSRRMRAALLTAAIVWNVFFYWVARPLPSRSLPAAVVNAYAVQYTHYALENRWAPNLTELRR